MALIYLPIGSVGGTSVIVAQHAHDQLTQQGHQVVMDESPSVAHWQAQAFDAILVCTSTTGISELPSAMELFRHQLFDQFPLLNGKPFGVISLGDSMYSDFCNGGKLIEECLYELQGSQPHPRLTLDASETTTPEEDMKAWLTEWEATVFASN